MNHKHALKLLTVSTVNKKFIAFLFCAAHEAIERLPSHTNNSSALFSFVIGHEEKIKLARISSIDSALPKILCRFQPRTRQVICKSILSIFMNGATFHSTIIYRVRRLDYDDQCEIDVDVFSELLPHQIVIVEKLRRANYWLLLCFPRYDSLIDCSWWFSWTHERHKDKLAGLHSSPTIFYRKTSENYLWFKVTSRAPQKVMKIFFCFVLSSETYQAGNERLTKLWNSRSHLIFTASFVCQLRRRVARWRWKCSLSFAVNRSWNFTQLSWWD